MATMAEEKPLPQSTKSKVLVVGATGILGREMVKASLAAGHPTFALVRETSFSRAESSLLLQSFATSGVTILKGSLQDFPSLLEAVKQVDVVICAVPSSLVLEQHLLIQAIKQADCIKRFIPSEFGADPDKVQILGMDYDFYKKKAEVRRCIEKEGIPHTYISCNFLMRYLLPSLVQPGLQTPPRDKVKIFGDGNVKAVFVKDCDVAGYTICAIDDTRTLNKVLYLRPPGNVYSQNQLIETWELKIGKKLEKIYITEEELLKSIHENPFPSNRDSIFIYSAFIKGDHTYFSIDSCGLDGTKLYPHVRCTTISEYLDSLINSC
ncbi:putative pinoresinol-lariciresinol reductase 3 isoform X1 [Canna indica]|uniref:Pinoresinol-lariciresinol reductase 3 isoform X1 n=1 Tax=Canna indica TaxID=4628 RepID=A0AAQ3QBF3_9LILI|nr:putative pinoresinol-lariciresinol reductase 3 isoform X1 [Canna indica]